MEVNEMLQVVLTAFKKITAASLSRNSFLIALNYPRPLCALFS